MKTLVVIDINNFIYRAFFGIQERLTSPDGQPVNAVYGVATMIHRLLTLTNPTSVVVAKDSQNSARKNVYSRYKESRQKMPSDLASQIPLIYEMIAHLDMPTFEFDGYEADDVIYSVVHKFRNDFDRIVVASGDKDLMQLVDDKVKCLDTMKNKEYGPRDVFEKFGVTPAQITTFLALVGDTSDCVPGVSMIGPKTAAKLIASYGTIDALFAHVSELPEGKIKSNIVEQEAEARLSLELVTLVNVPIPDAVGEYFPSSRANLIAFFERLAMVSLVAKFGSDK
jgi:DNA polymerase-1